MIIHAVITISSDDGHHGARYIPGLSSTQQMQSSQSSDARPYGPQLVSWERFEHHRVEITRAHVTVTCQWGGPEHHVPSVTCGHQWVASGITGDRWAAPG